MVPAKPINWFCHSERRDDSRAQQAARLQYINFPCYAPSVEGAGTQCLREDLSGEHIGSPLRRICPNIPEMIQWFKTMSTNEYIRGVKSGKFPPFEKSIWQRNYYEHIIRTENDLNNIRLYIKENPNTWNRDNNNSIYKNSQVV